MTSVTAGTLSPLLTHPRQETQPRISASPGEPSKAPEGSAANGITTARFGHSLAAPLTVPSNPPRQVEGPAASRDKSEDGAAAKADTLPESVAAEFKISTDYKLQVRFDEASERFVYFKVDTQSGEVERQYPPEEALRVIARSREVAGLTVDKKL